MIVGDGAESASLLRPHCLPSGGRRRQHPLKWPGYDTKDDKKQRGSCQITAAEQRVRGASFSFTLSDGVQGGGGSRR